MSIEYVARRDLDTSLWDQAVSAPANGFIYARSSYLDLLADNWDALVIAVLVSTLPSLKSSRPTTRSAVPVPAADWGAALYPAKVM